MTNHSSNRVSSVVRVLAGVILINAAVFIPLLTLALFFACCNYAEAQEGFGTAMLPEIMPLAVYMIALISVVAQVPIVIVPLFSSRNPIAAIHGAILGSIIGSLLAFGVIIVMGLVGGALWPGAMGFLSVAVAAGIVPCIVRFLWPRKPAVEAKDPECSASDQDLNAPSSRWGIVLIVVAVFVAVVVAVFIALISIWLSNAYLARIDTGTNDNAQSQLSDQDQAPSDRTAIPESYKSGVQLYQSGKLDEAIAAYTDAIGVAPNFALAHLERGKAFAAIAQFDRAIADFDQAIELDPRLPDAFNERGLAYARMGDLQRAIEEFDEAIRLDEAGNSPATVRAYPLCNRGHAYDLLGKTAEAKTDYDAALALAPSLSEAYYYRSVLWRRRGDLPKAIADLTAAIDSSPNDPRALHLRAYIQSTSNDDEFRNGKQAVVDAKKACEITDWKDPSIIATLSAAHAELVLVRRASLGLFLRQFL